MTSCCCCIEVYVISTADSHDALYRVQGLKVGGSIISIYSRRKFTLMHACSEAIVNVILTCVSSNSAAYSRLPSCFTRQLRLHLSLPEISRAYFGLY